MGSRTSFACVETRARRDASWDTGTNAATARGVRTTVGGIESLRATPAPRQSEEQVKRLTAELAEVTAERDDYAATVDDFIKDHKPWQEKALTPEKHLDSYLEPPEGNTDATEEPSESSSETSFDSLREAPTTGLRESTEELLSKSPTEVPKGETEDSSEASSNPQIESLTQKKMLRRLNVPPSTLSTAKKRPDFPQWSQKRDPEDIAWRWNQKTSRFVPAVDNQ